jgi:hypothetical protein
LAEKQRAIAFPRGPPYREGMPSNRTELQALKNLIADASLTLETTPDLPQNRTASCREALRAAMALVNDLIDQQRMTPAAALGKKGGATTAKRGSEYFRQLSAKRKTRAGGRPPKS